MSSAHARNTYTHFGRVQSPGSFSGLLLLTPVKEFCAKDGVAIRNRSVGPETYQIKLSSKQSSSNDKHRFYKKNRLSRFRFGY
jgi:hypothetical protein